MEGYKFEPRVRNDDSASEQKRGFVSTVRTKINGKCNGRASPLVTSSAVVWQQQGNKSICRIMATGGEGFYMKSAQRSYNQQMSSSAPENSRQRMKPWLEAKINSGTIPGLEWINKQLRVFKVPWKHVGNREWNEKDAEIFKEWAIHTGRYREGVDSLDFPTWKTRFRCALTKLPDIKELKDQNQLDGNMEEPYRVYQFLERRASNSPTDSKILGHQEVVEKFDEYKYDTFSQQTVIPTTVNSGSGSGSLDRSLASDLNSIPSGDLIHCNSREIKDIQENESRLTPMDTSLDGINVPDVKKEDFSFCEADISRKGRKEYPTLPTEMSPLQYHQYFDPNDCKLYLTIRYKQEVKVDQLCKYPGGIRIFFDKEIDVPTNLTDDIYGPSDVQKICLPSCDTQIVQQQKLTYQLLNFLDRGLFIKIEKGNIVATRSCRCSIFVSSPSLNNGETTKLVRGQPTVIYDLNYFKVGIDRFLHARGPKPATEVWIGFGQRFDQTVESLSGMLISAVVVHAEASNLLTTIECSSPVSPNLEISKSDNLDRLLDMMQHTQSEPMQF